MTLTFMYCLWHDLWWCISVATISLSLMFFTILSSPRVSPTFLNSPPAITSKPIRLNQIENCTEAEIKQKLIIAITEKMHGYIINPNIPGSDFMKLFLFQDCSKHVFTNCKLWEEDDLINPMDVPRTILLYLTTTGKSPNHYYKMVVWPCFSR